MKDKSDYLITQQFTPTIEKISIELNLRASSCFSSSANVTVYFVLQRPWFYLFSDLFLHLVNLGLWYAQITFHANIAEILLKVADNTMTITPVHASYKVKFVKQNSLLFRKQLWLRDRTSFTSGFLVM